MPQENVQNFLSNEDNQRRDIETGRGKNSSMEYAKERMMHVTREPAKNYIERERWRKNCKGDEGRKLEQIVKNCERLSATSQWLTKKRNGEGVSLGLQQETRINSTNFHQKHYLHFIPYNLKFVVPFWSWKCDSIPKASSTRKRFRNPPQNVLSKLQVTLYILY